MSFAMRWQAMWISHGQGAVPGTPSAHWDVFRAERTLLAIGPMEDPAEGALAIFTSREAAEQFARSDPFVTGGVVGNWDVTGWQEAILEPLSDPESR